MGEEQDTIRTGAAKLSLVIPCYNEEQTLSAIVEEALKLKSASLDVELVLVDDCSTDGSRSAAQAIAAGHPEVKLCFHERNAGKGAALRTGFMEATGDFIGIQDADLEYCPKDYLRMLVPLVEGRADVVFGSRYLQSGERRVLRWWHTAMNKFLTRVSNVFSDLDLTDMETCYKLFRRDIIRSIAPGLRENRFGFEPEVVAKVARLARAGKAKIAETAISYRPRTFAEGKKIGWMDGVRSLYCIVRYNLF